MVVVAVVVVAVTVTVVVEAPTMMSRSQGAAADTTWYRAIPTQVGGD